MPDSKRLALSYQPRRWLRFRLRTLLVVFTGVVVCFGLFVLRLHRARVQERAVQLITEAGGQVLYEYQQPELTTPHGIRSFSRREPPGPRWLRKLIGDHFFMTAKAVHFRWRINFPIRYNSPAEWPPYETGLAQLHLLDNLSVLTFRDTQITDADLTHLKELPKLYSLDLIGTPITDAGLVHLNGLSSLQVLLLRNTQVTDAGLVHLEGLSNLSSLDLGETQVTNAGLVHLPALTKLKALWLNNTQVTDAGLVHLSGMTNLTWLGLDETEVTDAGLVNLRELTRLKLLFRHNTQITDGGIKRLQDELPHLVSYPDRSVTVHSPLPIDMRTNE